MHVRNKGTESDNKGNFPLSQKEDEQRTFSQEIEESTLLALKRKKPKIQLLRSQSLSDLGFSVHCSGFEKKRQEKGDMLSNPL